MAGPAAGPNDFSEPSLAYVKQVSKKGQCNATGEPNMAKRRPVAIHNETSVFLSSSEEDGNTVFCLPRCPAIGTGTEDSRGCRILRGSDPSHMLITGSWQTTCK